jgi:hypothetical protein
MTKNPKCKVCGTDDKEEFYASNKVMCKVCLSEKNKKEKEEIQKLLEKAMSPKVKTPRAVSPSRESKLLEAQEERITILESQLTLLLSQHNELLQKIENLNRLVEEKEEIKSVKIESPVKVVIDNLPLPLTPVRKPSSPKVSETKKVKLSKSEKNEEKINEILLNLNSYSGKELLAIIKEFKLKVNHDERNIPSYKRIIVNGLSE